jgi:integrase
MQRHLAKLIAHRPEQVSTPEASARVKNHHINILRSIGEFAKDKQLLIRNPFDMLERFDEPKRYRKVFTIAELRRMLSDGARYPWRHRKKTEALVAAHKGDLEAAAKAAVVPVEAIRHRLDAKEGKEDDWWIFVVLAAYTGMRSETLRLLKWHMVDWEARRLRVPAEDVKSNSAVRAPIQPELGEILHKLQPHSKSVTLLPDSIAGVTSDRANERTQAFLLRNGVIPNGRSVHCFRHTVASLLTASGMSSFLVMDAVGHSAIDSSKHYSHGADEFREQVVKEKWKEGEFYFRRKPPSKAKKR